MAEVAMLFEDIGGDERVRVESRGEARLAAEALIVDVEGFEGPLDVLLTLSRTQKVDLRKISVLHLAQQYLDFIEHAKVLRIELAADYLVMAAWLAFLKSRLLLPQDPDEELSGEEMAAHLAFRLERLRAMRDAASRLMARDRLGRDFFARGIPEEMKRRRRVTFTATLLDLMQGYAHIRTRDDFRPFVIDREAVYTVEQALERMRSLIGRADDWTDLASYMPENWQAAPARRRSATASNLAASLELTREGQAEIRQNGTFAPIEIRRKASRHD